MAPQKVSRPVTAVAGDEPRGGMRDLLGGSKPSDSKRTEKAQVFAALRGWSPATSTATGIKPVEEGSARHA
jgi:hypothetical protein